MRVGRALAGAGLMLALGLPSMGPALAWAGELSAVTAGSSPELRLKDLEGQPRGLDELRGKVVLVNFWASWCTPCVTEMPSIQRLAEALRDRPFAVLAVNVAEGQGRAKAAAQQMGLALPVLLDEDGALFNRWGSKVLPSTYVLDQEGLVRYLGQGPLEWDGMEALTLIQGLLGGPGGTPTEAASD